MRIVYDDLRFGQIEETYDSVDDVIHRLRAIGAEFSRRVGMPFGIDLVATNGDRLSVALGLNNAVVSRFNDTVAESVTAVGDPSAVGSTLFYFGDHTLMPNTFLISVEVALRIVRQWCEDSTLSPLTEWTSQIR
jgi:hypothetical protein